MSDLTPTHADGGDTTSRMERFQSLEPGTYWRARVDVQFQLKHWKEYFETVKAGTVLLLTAVDVYDAAAHTIELAKHPSQGGGHHHMLVNDFLNAFEYAADGEAVRAAEMQAIHGKVAALQQELVDGQQNPAIMATAIAEGIHKWEADKQAELDREAARSGTKPLSAALTVAGPTGALRTDLGFVLENRLTTQDVVAMRLIAEREAKRAELTAGWLTARTEAIANTIKALTPYLAEKAQVALARTSQVRQYAADLMKGIATLDLYTGKGVTIETIATGESAPRDQKLHLRQAKLFADAEFAAWAEVGADWDYRSLKDFDRALASNPSFRDQILPQPRMVVAMATRRTAADYSHLSAFEAAMRDVRNKVTFLLVRDGENIYRVYSAEPTHEATPRLFPTTAEIDAVFRGYDGSNLTIRDLEFTDAVKDHEALALHYKRFLILLCGLAHRESLFGPFYDPAEALQFLSLDFQQRHFVFIADDEPQSLIGAGRPPVQTFIATQNAQLRSGSRVLCYFDRLLDPHTAPGCMRRDGDHIRHLAEPIVDSAELIAYKDGHELCVDVPVKRCYGADGRFNARVSLTAAKPERGGESGVICVDGVKAEVLEWYVLNRQSRVGYISYIRLFKEAAARLREEEAAEAPARAYLRAAIADANVTAAEKIDELLDSCIVAWRCAQRGRRLPDVTEKRALQAILDLVWAQENSGDLLSLALQWIAANRVRPLRVSLTGKSRVAVYTEVPEAERNNAVMDWGWVRRYSLGLAKGRLVATSDRMEWLTAKPNNSETTLREWPELSPWMHPLEEPCKPAAISHALTKIEEGIQTYLTYFKGPGAGIDPQFLAGTLQTMEIVQRRKKGVVTDVNLTIAVGAYMRPQHRKPDQLLLLGMSAPLVKWLQHFANERQRAVIERIFLRPYANPEMRADYMARPFSPWLCCFDPNADAFSISEYEGGRDAIIRENGVLTGEDMVSRQAPFSSFVANVRAGGTEPYRKSAGRPARVAFAKAIDALSGEQLDAFFHQTDAGFAPALA